MCLCTCAFTCSTPTGRSPSQSQMCLFLDVGGVYAVDVFVFELKSIVVQTHLSSLFVCVSPAVNPNIPHKSKKVLTLHLFSLLCKQGPAANDLFSRSRNQRCLPSQTKGGPQNGAPPARSSRPSSLPTAITQPQQQKSLHFVLFFSPINHLTMFWNQRSPT